MVNSLKLLQKTSLEYFNEHAYLEANPDVANAVATGVFKSGRQHFEIFGQKEGRKHAQDNGALHQAKLRKHKKLFPLLRQDMPHTESEAGYDFLTEELRSQFKIVDTNAVSSNEYDGNVRALIDKHQGGLILDCGAGKRAVYYDNVVNFEIVQYPSTDVRGVGEVLPFKDCTFDAVISSAVLEHVKDPFRCAAEIVRVLKPDGDLYCCVPFLVPLHGYPHHYYNMTHQGLANLFEANMTIESIEVIDSVKPIWALTWIIQSWASGLSGKTKQDFLDLKINDLMGNALDYLQLPFVKNLSPEKNLELAAGCVLKARKIR